MKNVVCIVCPNSCRMTVKEAEGGWDVCGNLCPRGKKFAISEMTNPARRICSTVRTIYPMVPRLPVRTDGEVPKIRIFDVMGLINRVLVDHPVHSGEVILRDVCGTGVNIISTSDIYGLVEEGE